MKIINEFFKHYKIRVGDKTYKVKCEDKYYDALLKLNDKDYDKILGIMVGALKFLYNDDDGKNLKSESYYVLKLAGHNPIPAIRKLILENEPNSVIAFKTHLNNGDIRILVSRKNKFMVFEMFANHKDLG